jgi:hypothetical protein
MKVLYNNSEIKNGIFLTPTETHREPKIEYHAKPNSLYTLIMHDPDAVGGNLLHWVIVNIAGDDVNTGEELFEYKGPAPPKGSGTHKYIFLFFEQAERINTQIDSRIMPMDGLYKKLHVGLRLLSSVYFTSKNQDGGKKKQRTKSKKLRNIRKNKKGTRKSSTSTFGKG